jgi:hypothetical protein
MCLFYSLNFIIEKHKKYGFSKSNIMDYNFDNIFLCGLWNGPISYDVLVRYHIFKIKFENFCMTAFARFYLWTFKQAK